MTYPRRGEIYLVEFDPTRGHEIQKNRPAVILQNDLGNRYSSITIVAAMSTAFSSTPYPVEVVVHPAKGNGLSASSAVLLNQIRSIDRQRLIRRLGMMDAVAMRQIDGALKISLGLVHV